MRSFLREYGLLIAAIVIGVSGVLYYQAHKEEVLGYKSDMLEYGLNMIGEKLYAMVEDGAGNESVAALFEQFKQRVLNQDVAPEQVEQVAVSILNLSNTGTRLTPDQAGEVFQMINLSTPEPAAAPDPAARPETPPKAPPVQWASLESLGDRLNVLLEFDRAVDEACAEDEKKKQDLWQRMHYRFKTKEGVRINIDTRITEAFQKEHLKEFEKAVKLAEEKQMVAWKQDLAEEIQRQKEHQREALRNLEELKKRHRVERDRHTEALSRLEAIRNLELKGVEVAFNADSLQQIIEAALEEAQAEIENAQREVERELEKIHSQ